MRGDWKNRPLGAGPHCSGKLFAYPVFLAFMAGKADRDWNTAAEAFHWFSEQSIRWISFENGVAVFFVVVVFSGLRTQQLLLI